MNIDIKQGVGGRGKGATYSLPIKKDLSDIEYAVEVLGLLMKPTYRDLFYMILEKKFIYYKDLVKWKDKKWTKYLDKLKDLGLIQQIKVNSKVIDYLIEKNNLGLYHIEKLKFYGLTQKAMELYDSYFDVIYEEASVSAKTKVQNDMIEFKEIINKIDEKKERVRINNQKRYEILKTSQYKTFEQELFIQEFERQVANE